MHHYLPLADKALVLDNSIAGFNKVIASKPAVDELKIEEAIIWKEIQEVANVK